MKNVVITVIALLIILGLLIVVAVYGQKEIGKLRARTDMLEAKVSGELSRAAASLEALQTENASWKATQEKSAKENQTRIEELTKQITAQQEKIAGLESDLTASLDETKKQAEKYGEEIEDQKKKIADLKKEITKLKEQSARQPQTPPSPRLPGLDLKDAPPEVAEWLREETQRRVQGQPPREYPEEVRKWLEEQRKK